MFVFTNSYPKTHEEKRPIKSKALRPSPPRGPKSKKGTKNKKNKRLDLHLGRERNVKESDLRIQICCNIGFLHNTSRIQIFYRMTLIDLSQIGSYILLIQ